jgi:hypothetical protein
LLEWVSNPNEAYDLGIRESLFISRVFNLSR